jgi:peptidoglycan/LPS O-acetylase OafA/YrhL
MTAANTVPSHIPALDGLRGVAVLLVVQYHITIYGGFQPASLLERVVYVTSRAGWSGVDLFFVLSGFLITRILYASKGSEYFFRHFYIRRALRIFPLYYATLAVFFLAGPLVFPADESFQRLQSVQAWYWAYLVNVDIAFNGWHPFVSIGHFWTLAVEEQFYVVWPFAVYLLDRRHLVRVCAAAIGVAFLVRIGLAWDGQNLAPSVLTPARMDTLALGSLLALLAADSNGLRRWIRPALWAGAGSTTLLVAIALWERGLRSEHPLTVMVGLSALACVYGSVLLLAVTSPERALLTRILTPFWQYLCPRPHDDQSGGRILTLLDGGPYSFGKIRRSIELVQRIFCVSWHLPTVGSGLAGKHPE